MKLSVAISTLALLPCTAAFATAPFGTTRQQSSGGSPRPLFASTETKNKKEGGIASELAIPCEDECALVKYPNLPESVHPGVLSGQAQVDLLNHAKENGELRRCIAPRSKRQEARNRSTTLLFPGGNALLSKQARSQCL
jgi:hypothetical protein